MVFQDSTNLNNASKYIVDTNGDTPYTTVQAAITAANTAALPAMVYVRAGTYTEDLTLFSTIDIVGDDEQTIIRGVHTPPNAGTLRISNITLTSPTDIFESAAAGTTDITLDNCQIDCDNGFTFDLDNWTGTLQMMNVFDDSTLNGVVNNTGGCNVNIWHSLVGAGVTVLVKTGGELAIFNSKVANPITTAGAAIVNAIMGSYFENTVTLGGTTTSEFIDCSFETGANTAITHSSANETSLSNISIDTSNITAIDGAGAGNLLIGDITFLDSSALAGTLTLDRTPVLTTGVARTTVIEAVGEGAGAQNVIDITPNTAIGGVAWAGVFIDGAALDPTAANSVVHAFECDMSGVDTTNNPDLVGAHITMPALPSEGCDSAIRLEGYGLTSIFHCSERVAASFTDGNIQQSQDITGFTALDTAAGRIVNIDNTGSTGGDYHALDVSVTGAGTAATVAVGTNPEVAVIHQHTGVFAATAQSWKFNGGFTDVTAAFDNPGVDVTIFDGDDDYIYIGANAAFSQIRVILETVAGRNIRPIFEYSTVGPVWVPFDPIDGTDGFLQNGIIQWTSGSLAAWAAVVVNLANHFYIRIQRTRNNIVTIPVEDIIRILEPVEYSWNEDGDILAASVTANGLADTTGTQYEILTFGAGGILNGIGPLTDGQLVIGDTGGTAVAATLASADGSVTITNGAGTIDLSAAGMTWSVEAGAGVAAAVNSGYISNRGGGVTYTIPTTAAVGSIIRICSILGLSTIAQNAAESIVYGAFTTTVGIGGSLVATNVGDTIEIICTVADTTWAVLSSVGNWTVN